MPIKNFLAHRSLGRMHKARLPGGRQRTHMASRMVIGRPPSWWRRSLWIAGTLILAGATGFGLYIAGQRSAGYDGFSARKSIADLRIENADLRTRHDQLTKAHDGVLAQLRIEQGARQALEAQVGRMEEERGRLSQDLALFENLFPSNGKDGMPAIRGFRIEPVGTATPPSTWRYRVLVMRDGQPRDEFNGNFRLSVRYRINNREVVAAAPGAGNVASTLRFRTYQRIEGSFQAPRTAVLLGATARVEENGKLVSESVFRP